LLLVVGAHLERERDDEEGGEEGVGEVERDRVDGRVVWLEARELREVGRGGAVVGEEEVLGEFGGEEEEVLDEGDEDEVEEREGPLWEALADDEPAVVLLAPGVEGEEAAAGRLVREAGRPGALKGEDEEHARVEVGEALDLARDEGPEGEVGRVDERERGPQAVDLRDVACERARG